jgi:UPF0755 protein
MIRRQQKINRMIYIIGIIVIFGIGVLWWLSEIQPINKSFSRNAFSIEQGAGLRLIAFKLKDEGLIRDPYTFLLAVKILGVEGSIQAGSFELSPSMDVFTIAKKLTKGTNDIKVTFPEGKRAEEIAAIISSHLPNTVQDLMIPKLIEQEGYLFPDTYYFRKSSTVDDVIQIMKANFDKKYATLSLSSNLSKGDIVILASLIEREAKHAIDRPLIASVIYNRYKIGMKLDIDATVQYAIGYDYNEHSWWKKGLTRDDLVIDSPFNTYTNAGLPPAPISNPGLTSLQAAGNPADTDYFYYMTDKQGINHYARTLQEQNENIRRYGVF